MTQDQEAQKHKDYTERIHEVGLVNFVDEIITHQTKEYKKAIEGMRKNEVKWVKAKHDVKSVDAVLFNRGLDAALSVFNKEV